MIDSKTVTGIIVAAGSGVRYGSLQSKVLEAINGQPVIMYSINAFDSHPMIDSIVVVCRDEDCDTIEELLRSSNLKKKYYIAKGGNTRSDSVKNGLSCVDTKIVIIHDAARPMIKASYITSCLTSLSNFEGVTVAVASTDTVKYADKNGIVISTPARESCWLVQTPQAFYRETLLKAYESLSNNDIITDDCSALERCGIPIKLIPGDKDNIKLTYPSDKELLEFFISRKE